MEKSVFLAGHQQRPDHPYQNLPRVNKASFVSSGSVVQPQNVPSFKIKLPLQNPSQRRNIQMSTHCRYEDTFETSEKRELSAPGTHPYQQLQSKFDSGQMDTERLQEKYNIVSQPLSVLKQSLTNIQNEGIKNLSQFKIPKKAEVTDVVSELGALTQQQPIGERTMEVTFHDQLPKPVIRKSPSFNRDKMKPKKTKFNQSIKPEEGQGEPQFENNKLMDKFQRSYIELNMFKKLQKNIFGSSVTGSQKQSRAQMHRFQSSLSTGHIQTNMPTTNAQSGFTNSLGHPSEVDTSDISYLTRQARRPPEKAIVKGFDNRFGYAHYNKVRSDFMNTQSDQGILEQDTNLDPTAPSIHIRSRNDNVATHITELDKEYAQKLEQNMVRGPAPVS